MFKKIFIAYFTVLLIPMFIVSAILNLSYGLNASGHIQINWIIVILLALVLDAFIAWMQTRKVKEKEI
jgi:hypothetical protein